MVGGCWGEGIEAFDEGCEAEFLEMVADGGGIESTEGAAVDVEIVDLDIGTEGDEIACEGEDVGVFLEFFAEFWGEFVEVFQDLVSGAVLGDEFGGGFFADAGDTRDVVGGVAGEGLDFDGLVGGIATECLHFGEVGDFAGLHVVHFDGLGEELSEVFVFGDDEEFVIGGREESGNGGDEVIGFESGVSEDGDTGIADDSDDALFLGREVFRGRGAVGFVLGVEACAFEVSRSGVDDHGEVIGVSVGDEVEEPLSEDEGGLGGFTGGAGEFAEGCVVGAEDLGMSVNDVEGLGHGGGLLSISGKAGLVARAERRRGWLREAWRSGLWVGDG